MTVLALRAVLAGATVAAVVATTPLPAVAQDSSSYRSAPRRRALPKPKPSPTPVQSQVEAPAAPAPPPPAPPPPQMVGGAVMALENTIFQNVGSAPNLSTFAATARTAGLDATLAGVGPYTVFVPTNEAFAQLPPATMTALMQPANKPTLSKIMSYHVVSGALTFADLKARIEAGAGTAQLTTLAGQPLTAQLYPLQAGGETIVVTSANGNKSYVTTADVKQANGVFHVVNGVLSPTL